MIHIGPNMTIHIVAHMTYRRTDMSQVINNGLKVTRMALRIIMNCTMDIIPQMDTDHTISIGLEKDIRTMAQLEINNGIHIMVLVIIKGQRGISKGTPIMVLIYGLGMTILIVGLEMASRIMVQRQMIMCLKENIGVINIVLPDMALKDRAHFPSLQQRTTTMNMSTIMRHLICRHRFN